MNEIWIRLKHAIKNYFIGLVKLAILSFIVLMIGLYLIGISNWAIKAFFIAIVDMIPLLGSGMILIPWAFIRALSGSVDVGAQLAILYVVIVVVRLIGEPLLVGKSVGVPPLLTIGITIVSIMILGPIGAVVSGVLAIPIRVIWELYSGKSPYAKMKIDLDDSDDTTTHLG